MSCHVWLVNDFYVKKDSSYSSKLILDSYGSRIKVHDYKKVPHILYQNPFHENHRLIKENF